MATEPIRINIHLKFDRTEQLTERYPAATTTYYISANEAEIMIERDLELRRRDTDAPEQIGPAASTRSSTRWRARLRQRQAAPASHQLPVRPGQG